MKAPKNREIIVRRVNLLWYPVALVPILLLAYAALQNWVPGLLIVLAAFAFFFWLFSLGFAIWSLFRKPVEPRQ